MKLTVPFHQRLRNSEFLFATFVKTTSHQTIEVLATTGLDAIVLDAEHAPFGVESLDICLLAARACQLPALVRVPDGRPETIQRVLDLGACGVMVPHVESAADARAVVSAARYRGGSRGFSGSTRAGGYGMRSMGDHLRLSDEELVTVVQVESSSSVDAVSDIASVQGVDCLFVGPADLAVSFGSDDPGDARVSAAGARACRAAAAAGRAAGYFVGDVEDVPKLGAQGVRFFVIKSDQSFMRTGVAQALTSARKVFAA